MKQLKIPDKVRVGAMEYSVEDADIVVINDRTNYKGCCDYEELKILLLSDLPKQRREETFFHELLHAIFFESGMMKQDDEFEKLVENAGRILYQVMRDNYFYEDDADGQDTA